MIRVSDKQLFIPHTRYFLNIQDTRDIPEDKLKNLVLGSAPVYEYNEESTELLSRTLGYGDIRNLTTGILIEEKYDEIIVSLYVGQTKYPFAYFSGPHASQNWNYLLKKSESNGLNSKITFFFLAEEDKIVFLNEASAALLGLPDRRKLFFQKMSSYTLQRFYAYPKNGDIRPGEKIQSSSSCVRIRSREELTQKFNSVEALKKMGSSIESKCDILLQSQYDPNYEIWGKQFTKMRSPVADTCVQLLFNIDPLKKDPFFRTKWELSQGFFGVDVFSPVVLNLSEIDIYRPSRSDDELTMNMIGVNNSSEINYEIEFGVIEKPIDKYLTSGEWSCLYWPNERVVFRYDGAQSVAFNDDIYLFRRDEEDYQRPNDPDGVLPF